MGEFLIGLIGLAALGGGLVGILVLVWFALTPGSSTQPNQEKKFVQSDPTTADEEAKGDPDRLPQHLMEQISKIIEEKTGVKLPKAKTPEEILASIPAKDRAKLLPTLIPILVDAIREATGMNIDASLRLQEFLLGQGLGLTELDVAIETDAMKMDKTLAALQRYQEIVAPYKETLERKALTDFVVNMFDFKLLQETFKDMQLPPGWSPQQVAGLLQARSIEDEEERDERDH